MAITDADLEHRARLVVVDDHWYVDELGTTKGNRTKFLATPLSEQARPIREIGRPWFWKASLTRYPIEFWSEVCAYHIGSVIGIDVPPCLAASYDDRFGALSLMMADPRAGETLIHGGDLLTSVKLDYERKTGSDHSVQLVRETLEKYHLGAIYPKLFQQFLLDAILGNGDRHQDNWGLVVYSARNFELELLPAFDNGSSLGRELQPSKLRQILDDSTALDLYIRHGRAHIRWDTNGNLEQVPHEVLIQRHYESFPELRLMALRFLGFSAERVEAAIRRIGRLSRTAPGVELSEDREEFMVRVVLRRRERLLSALSKSS